MSIADCQRGQGTAVSAVIITKEKDQLSLTNLHCALDHGECAATNKVDADCDKLATELS